MEKGLWRKTERNKTTLIKLESEETGGSVEKVKTKWLGKLRSTRGILTCFFSWDAHFFLHILCHFKFWFCYGERWEDFIVLKITHVSQVHPNSNEEFSKYFNIKHVSNVRESKIMWTDLCCELFFFILIKPVDFEIRNQTLKTFKTSYFRTTFLFLFLFYRNSKFLCIWVHINSSI